MADSVNRILEEMVPELEALDRKGYFNKQEIRSIIEKRKKFEYQMKRNKPILADFFK